MNAVHDIELPFEHRQAAHCESGATASLLRHAGLEISEAMAFGIGGGLTYAYLPFVKFGGQPLFAYRAPLGAILRNVARRLGVQMHFETFRRPQDGMAALDARLAAGQPVGLQASAYWLDYFPPDMRFHFNAHNLVAYGRRGDSYLVSDPVIDIRVECQRDALQKARFTRGVMAPKGKLYFPVHIPDKPDFRRAARRAIRHTAGMMLYTPAPIIGIRGMRRVARRVERLSPTEARANHLLLGHIVRMQEEIGTGGAGFRFLYAAFLQEAAQLLDLPALDAQARTLGEVGDQWRMFALDAAKMCKGRQPDNYPALAEQIRACAAGEEAVFRRLRQIVKRND